MLSFLFLIEDNLRFCSFLPQPLLLPFPFPLFPSPALSWWFWGWTQGMVHAKQALYHWPTAQVLRSERGEYSMCGSVLIALLSRDSLFFLPNTMRCHICFYLLKNRQILKWVYTEEELMIHSLFKCLGNWLSFAP